MRQTIKKWGNSLAVRLSASVADAARLTENQEVEVTVNSQGKIVVESAWDVDDFDFDKFVAAITPDNIPALVNVGEARGRELGGDDDPYRPNQRRPARESTERATKQSINGKSSRKKARDGHKELA